jgi:hypothetical protein
VPKRNDFHAKFTTLSDGSDLIMETSGLDWSFACKWAFGEPHDEMELGILDGSVCSRREQIKERVCG